MICLILTGRSSLVRRRKRFLVATDRFQRVGWRKASFRFKKSGYRSNTMGRSGFAVEDELRAKERRPAIDQENGFTSDDHSVIAGCVNSAISQNLPALREEHHF